ncbi:MAG TPA: hypothetical protein VHK67_06545 [Rhabdochlamydiaceae bacterium]|nr:hypothetical protein [Rhabdochlamydiaceae bacterium]
MKLRLFVLLMIPIFIFSNPPHNYTWGQFEILQPTERKPARTLVLVVTSPDDTLDLRNYRDCRWVLGKKVWEQYMDSHPNVDCYFLQNAKLREGTSEQIWIEGNTIYVGEEGYKDHGIPVRKTIIALEKLLPHYTHFFRTNVNAFVNLKQLNEYAETHHQSMYTGPLWQLPFWYLLGYGLLFSSDVAAHIVSEYRRLEGSYLASHYPPEDLVLTALATGIFPYYDYIGEHNLQQGFIKKDLKFTLCPSLPFGVRQLMCGASYSTTRLSLYGVQLSPVPSFEEAIEYCKVSLSQAILYRMRSGYDLDKFAELYQFLLDNIYPDLPKVDLIEFAKTLPTIRYDNS